MLVKNLRSILVATSALAVAGWAVWQFNSPNMSAPDELSGKTIISLNAYPSLLTPAEAARLSTVGIRGSIVAIDEPRWSTADAKQPSYQSRGVEPNVIYRVATVRVAETIFGEAPATVRIPLLGGVVGDTIMVWDEDSPPAMGDEVILFLVQPPANWRLGGTDFQVVQRYALNGDVATTPMMPAVSVKDLLVAARGAAVEPKVLPTNP